MKRINYLCIIVFCLTLCLIWPEILRAASGTSAPAKNAAPLSSPAKSTPPSPAAKAPAPTSKALAKAMPDLVVSKVWVDASCLLNVAICNVGKGPISPAEHGNGKLTITIDKTDTHFFFTKPTLNGPAMDLQGKLKHPGATLEFNTRIALMKPASVTAMVDADKAIDESNEKNNLTSIQLTSGKCKPQATAIKKKALAKPGSAERLSVPNQMAQNRMRATASIGSIIDAHGVDFNTRPMSFGDGINIHSIDEVTAYSFILRYSVDESLANGDITFYMLHGGEQVAQTTRPFDHGGGDPSVHVFMAQNFSWSLPVNLVNDDNYGIIAVKSDGLGISDPFTVNLPYRPYATGMGMSIEFTHPVDSTYFLHGQEIQFTIACTCRSSIDQVHLQLVPATGGGAAAYDFSILNTGGPFTSFNKTWTIPTHIPRGDYRLLAEAGVSGCASIENLSAYSRVFSINPPLPEPAPGERNTISIRSPSAGDTIYTGDHNQLWVQWSCAHCDGPDDLSYTRVLLKNGEELQRIGPTHAGGDMSPMEWFSIFGYLSGSDYQVQIELNRFNSDTERPEMIWSETTGNFSIINNTMGYLSDTNPVLLRSPSGFGGASFAVGSTLEITWSHAPERSTTHRLRLTLTRDATEGGGEWPIVGNISSYPYSYDWVIPDGVPPGAGYRVLVERVDGAGSSNSYIPFSITPRP
jgi:hypothetical protein